MIFLVSVATCIVLVVTHAVAYWQGLRGGYREGVASGARQMAKVNDIIRKHRLLR